MMRMRTRQSGGEQLRGPALTGARAVVTGAVLYTAIRAVLIRASGQAARRRREDETRGGLAGTPLQENGFEPSLALPNRRWSGVAAQRR